MMDKVTKKPHGKTLLEQLEEKHQLPVTIIKNSSICAFCGKPFTWLLQPAAELHSTPEGLPIPILYLLFLFHVCGNEYRSGGGRRGKVLAAVEESLAREMEQ
jgi:hypothetical protein